MKTVALVACVSKKQQHSMRARELYQSTWFRKAAAYAQQQTAQWYILSAKYGLLEPDKIIAPYDETLNTMVVRSRRAWAVRVWQQLQGRLQGGERVIVLAGVRYREYLVKPLQQRGCTVEVPLAGLRIGEQLRWLTQQLEV